MPRMTDTQLDAAMSMPKKEIARQLVEAEQVIASLMKERAETLKELLNYQLDTYSHT
jgi:hypothetical protein